ncbi:MAG: hypothetical protein ACK5HL_02120 [Bacilli bacterium]
MKIQAWKKFAESGKIEDYLEYSRMKEGINDNRENRRDNNK